MDGIEMITSSLLNLNVSMFENKTYCEDSLERYIRFYIQKVKKVILFYGKQFCVDEKNSKPYFLT